MHGIQVSAKVLVSENFAVNNLGCLFFLVFPKIRTTTHWKAVRVFLSHANLAYQVLRMN